VNSRTEQIASVVGRIEHWGGDDSSTVQAACEGSMVEQVAWTIMLEQRGLTVTMYGWTRWLVSRVGMTRMTHGVGRQLHTSKLLWVYISSCSKI
jgi:hypothetical protein